MTSDDGRIRSSKLISIPCHVQQPTKLLALNVGARCSIAITLLRPSSHSTSLDLRREARARKLSPPDMVFTRGNSYDRLEGGLGPNRNGRNFAWKKFAIGAAVLIGFVWVLGPRSSVDIIPGAFCNPTIVAYSHTPKTKIFQRLAQTMHIHHQYIYPQPQLQAR